MGEQVLPISEAHRRALEARNRMIEARRKHTLPRLPDKVAADVMDCDEAYGIAAGLYGEAADAYLAGDVASGQFYQAWAREYMAKAQTCIDMHPF